MNSYRSLMIKNPFEESPLNILERLAREGFLQNNRKLGGTFNLFRSSRFYEVISSMRNLETLNLFGYGLTLHSLAHVFQTCPKLINLHIVTYECKTPDMIEHLKNQLTSGFQKLRCLDIVCFINNDSWPMIQEMLT